MRAPRKRPGETAQKQGRRFEKFWAKVFGVEPIKGSGSLWYLKLDVGDGVVILWSCKHTDNESFRISKALMAEAERAINGPGGIGGSTIPGLATSVGGEVFVTLRAEDFLRLREDGQAHFYTPSKGEQKRTRAKIPEILRDKEE